MNFYKEWVIFDPKNEEFVCILKTPAPDHSKHTGKGKTREEAIQRARAAMRSHFELIRELI